MTDGLALYNEIDDFAADWLENLIRAGHIAPGKVDRRSIVDLTPDDVLPYRQFHAFAGIGIWSAALREAGIRDDENIWTGSCPCQPLSQAGQRRGHADERHLWPAFHRLITECGPAIIFGEQVASPDGQEWLCAVRADLEAVGYAVGAADLCAAGAGVDFAETGEGQATIEWIRGAVLSCPDPFLAAELRDFAAWAGANLGVGPAHIRQRLYWMADAGCERGAGRRIIRDMGSETAGDEGASQERQRFRNAADDCCATRPLADAAQQQHNGTGDGRTRRRLEFADGGSIGDWIVCTDGKARPIKPGTLPLAHGYPGRVGILRAAGNAIVKAQAVQFIEAAMNLGR